MTPPSWRLWPWGADKAVDSGRRQELDELAELLQEKQKLLAQQQTILRAKERKLHKWELELTNREYTVKQLLMEEMNEERELAEGEDYVRRSLGVS